MSTSVTIPQNTNEVGTPESSSPGRRAEDQDDEDRRDAAEEVGVHDREGAQREEDRSRQAPHHCDQERERKDQALRDQEDLAIEEEGPRDLRERNLK